MARDTEVDRSQTTKRDGRTCDRLFGGQSRLRNMADRIFGSVEVRVESRNSLSDNDLRASSDESGLAAALPCDRGERGGTEPHVLT